MAIVALKFWVMDLTVTLHTYQPNLALRQKESVRRSMGRMASTAPFVFLGPVLKDPGPPLFGVTLEAGVFLGELVDLS